MHIIALIRLEQHTTAAMALIVCGLCWASYWSLINDPGWLGIGIGIGGLLAIGLTGVLWI